MRVRFILRITCFILAIASVIRANPYKTRFLTEPVIMPAEEGMSMLFAMAEFGPVDYPGYYEYYCLPPLPSS